MFFLHLLLLCFLLFIWNWTMLNPKASSRVWLSWSVKDQQKKDQRLGVCLLHLWSLDSWRGQQRLRQGWTSGWIWRGHTCKKIMEEGIRQKTMYDLETGGNWINCSSNCFGLLDYNVGWNIWDWQPQEVKNQKRSCLVLSRTFLFLKDPKLTTCLSPSSETYAFVLNPFLSPSSS